MSIIEAWENSRMDYQQRYIRFLNKFNETGNADDRGHMLEASYVLISIFGLSVQQIQELEHNNSRLTNADIRN